MRMMGMWDVSYWSALFLSEGVIYGLLLSLSCAIFTTGGLYNDGKFGAIFGLFFCFCLSVVPFSFFVCAFFDTPQSAGICSLLVLLGLYIVYAAILTAPSTSMHALTTACLLPPIALQMGAGSFAKNYVGPVS